MLARALAVFLGSTVLAPSVAAQEAVAALRTRAADLQYNLDHEEAVKVYRQAIAADPADPAGYRALATLYWLDIALRRGAVTVDEYMGRVARADVALGTPPAELAGAFREHAQRALKLAEQRLQAHPRDADSHYQVGATVGLMASYTATIEGRVLGAFRSARRAYDEHEKVLQIDPRRKDAGLIVGAYRYIVSTLALPMRWMAYIVGFGGDRERGIRLIEDAARYPGDSQTDAQLALVLIYNRERRYDEALRTLAALQERYPRNRLLWLEAGATAIRASRFAIAEAALNEGIAKLAKDKRQRMFGEEVYWHYKRGAARLGLGKLAAAEADLRLATAGEARDWLRGRAYLELGKTADLAGDRARALREYETALRLTRRGNDRASAAQAERLIKQPYK